MRGVRATVDRLDRPSAYFNNARVSFPRLTLASTSAKTWHLTTATTVQHKRRRFDKDQRDGDDDTAGMHPENREDDDPLKNATTLYVGNLQVPPLSTRSPPRSTRLTVV